MKNYVFSLILTDDLPDLNSFSFESYPVTDFITIRLPSSQSAKGEFR